MLGVPESVPRVVFCTYTVELCHISVTLVPSDVQVFAHAI